MEATSELQAAAPGEVHVRRALISVSDKTGVVELAGALHELGIELVSTGGTARELERAGLPARAVEDLTGFPEMMSGRVKTLNGRLYAGMLALRDDEEHLRAAAEHGIEQIDLVCVNLYPFEQTVARPDVPDAEAIENIDIGGPTMIRAAAKNHPYVVVLVDPADYGPVVEELRAGDGRVSPATRRRLAAAAFARTAAYDTAIAGWFDSQRLAVAYEKVADLRYGENPHQAGAYYARVGAESHLLAGVTQHHGKELSFNNLLDLSAARELVAEFDEPACAILKHNNPCGCAVGATGLQAYQRALACDPMSAYGGVIAANREIDEPFARELANQFIEVLIAPAYTSQALEILTGASKNVRLLEHAAPGVPREGREHKQVLGGVLVQDRDAVTETRADMRVMTAREPDEREWADLIFAWRVCRHVRSNAIVLARDGATIGIGAGQMSRVDAVRIAVEKAREFRPEQLAGSVLASDAYFPFPDGPELASAAGTRAMIQPGGSIRDALVVEAADRDGVAMVATDRRHFRH